MKELPIPVYMSCDDNYAIHLCVVVASIVKNTKSKIHFIFFVSKLSNENKARIVKVCEGHLLDFIESDMLLEKLGGLQSGHAHISMSACSRYFISELDFPYEKGIYLDCDVLVFDDIKKLYDIDLGENYLAGADDLSSVANAQKFNLERYFNSGVLLMNIKKMRDENLSSLFVKTSVESNGKFKYLDQDVLNLICGKQSMILPIRWGMVAQLFRKKITSKFFSKEEISSAIKNPAIVHFTGPDKPWNIPYGMLAHPWTPAYFYYANLAGFSIQAEKFKENYNPIKSLLVYLKRHLFFFLRLQYFKMRMLYAKNRKQYEYQIKDAR